MRNSPANMLVCTISVLLLAGCGVKTASETDGATSPGGTATAPSAATKDAYEEQVKSALQPVIDVSNSLAADAPTLPSIKDLALRLQTISQTYSDAAEQLASITPPADVTATLHERLVKANEQLAKAAADAQKAADKGDQKQVNRYQAAGAKYQETLTELAGEYAALGYDFTDATATEGSTTAPTTPTVPTSPTIPTVPTEIPTVPTTPAPPSGDSKVGKPAEAKPPKQ